MQIHEQTLLLTRPESKFKAQLCLINESLTSLKNNLSDFLHEKELSYFYTLKYEKRQHTYLLGRYAAKKAISTYYGIKKLNTVLVEIGVFQQPIVQCFEFEKIQTSLSHCNYFGAAITFPEAHPMGIDLEYINADNVQAIKSQLSREEKLLLNSTPWQNDSAVHYTILWTIKEALSKILKTGLMVSFDILEISSIKKENSFFISEFKYFFQYDAITFIIEDLVFSLVYPKKTNITINIDQIRKWVGRVL